MALAMIIATLVCLVGFLLGFVSLGSIALRAFRRGVFSGAEYFLISSAIGLIVIEFFVFLVQLTNHFRLGSLIIVFILAGVVVLEWKPLCVCLRGSFKSVRPNSSVEGFLLTCIVVIASLEFFASMAPLTGSDALHYHFTVQKQILQQGFRPIFSNSHSFLCGQQHLLIFLGLSLGNERLATGFIFLGGILTAASMACLISRWTSYKVTAAFTLLFLLTPVVFWQMSTSGAPDIYMALLVCTAVMLFIKKLEFESWQRVAFTGLLVGGIAGSKYTGCIIAASFLIAVVIEFRSVWLVLLFTLSSIISGCWPYVRNFGWTRDPFFPFLGVWFSSRSVDAYALKALANDTGIGSVHHLSQLIPFIFFAPMEKENLGFYDFFGPTVLAVSPMIFWAYRNNRECRILVLIWFLSGMAIFFSSGMPRFMLPIYPLALSFTAAGIEVISQYRWRICRGIAFTIVVLMIVSGAAGLGIYSQKPLLATLGFKSKREYLEQSAPEYQVVETINRLLKDQASPRNAALVFIRHTYYLEVPYLNGDPGTSFVVNPDNLRTSRDWKEFFENQGIGYVVRSPNYPRAIEAPLIDMEKSGDLTPFKEVEVQDFRGKRIDQDRNTIQVVILKVSK
jgi:hypothetical protein